MPFAPIPGQAPVELTATVGKKDHEEVVKFLNNIRENELNFPGSSIEFNVEPDGNTGSYALFVHWRGANRPNSKTLVSLTSEEATNTYKQELEVVARKRDAMDDGLRSVVREEEV